MATCINPYGLPSIFHKKYLFFTGHLSNYLIIPTPSKKKNPEFIDKKTEA